MTGLDLRLKRVAARLSVNEVARAMGVTASRISHIETRDRVTPEAERRFVEALAMLATVPSPKSDARTEALT
jgi:transcriptional regulator with XRE-family HTH domain